MSEHWAVIPVKGLRDSKTRLSNYLGDSKSEFVQAILKDVLSSVIGSGVFSNLVIISPDEGLAAQARYNKVSFLRQNNNGLNRAVDQARRFAVKEGASSLTTILADIPLAEPRDFAEIFHLKAGDPSVVLAPSLKGGTNVMLASPPGTIRPRYGRWSYSKHLRQAQAASIEAYSVTNSRISFDIDTTEDLIRLRRIDSEGKTRTGRFLLQTRPLMHHSRVC